MILIVTGGFFSLLSESEILIEDVFKLKRTATFSDFFGVQNRIFDFFFVDECSCQTDRHEPVYTVLVNITGDEENFYVS